MAYASVNVEARPLHRFKVLDLRELVARTCEFPLISPIYNHADHVWGPPCVSPNAVVHAAVGSLGSLALLKAAGFTRARDSIALEVPERDLMANASGTHGVLPNRPESEARVPS